MKTRRKLVDVKPFPCRCHPIDNATSSLGSSFKTDIKIIFQFSFVLHSICFVSLNALSITKATHKTLLFPFFYFILRRKKESFAVRHLKGRPFGPVYFFLRVFLSR